MLVQQKKTQVAQTVAPPGTSEAGLKAIARNIQLWSDAGILEPLPSNQGGRGRHRLFGVFDVALAAVAHRLHAIGINSLENLDFAVQSLRTDLINNPNAATITQALYQKTDPNYERWPVEIQLIPYLFEDEAAASTADAFGMVYLLEDDPERFGEPGIALRLRLGDICRPVREAVLESEVPYPAKIEQIGQRYIATLPDWPEVVSEKAFDEGTALETAAGRLEDAVYERLKDGAPIPVPAKTPPACKVALTGTALLRAAIAENGDLMSKRFSKCLKR